MQLTIKARLILAFAILISLSTIIFHLGNGNANVLNNWITVIIKTHTNRIKLAGKVAED
ncbi:MAG: methyl-accepting chemotaxis protein, partial [Ferruginibacter sp.]|nr:methyl-accepting chemotaxis protein [Cytophagales bacterium]